jgi:glycosyltransferase involved in cell wall biosynthesis
MKIIHIVPSVNIEASGPSHSVQGLCSAQLELKNEVSIAALDWQPEDSEGYLNPQSFVQVFPLGFGPKRLGRSPRMFDWLKRQLAESSMKETTILHNHGMWYVMALYFAWLKKSKQVKFIQSPRNALSTFSLQTGSRLKPIFWKLFQKTALKRVDCFHATSEAEYCDIRAMGFNQPVAIISNGVDVPALGVKKRVDGIFTLTYLGRLHPEKGIEDLLLAWASIQNDFKSWHLQVIGPGDKKYVSYLKKYSVELNLERLEFLGPKYGSEKWQAYRDSDLYVLPSPSENFGMTIAESLASGTPVIATKGAPWADLESHKTGWWIDLGVDPLIVTLRDAMSRDYEELVTMGMQGRKWMKEEFSWHQIGEEMIDVYNWLVDSKLEKPQCIRLD